jgi:hypothetical protein
MNIAPHFVVRGAKTPERGEEGAKAGISVKTKSINSTV